MKREPLRLDNRPLPYAWPVATNDREVKAMNRVHKSMRQLVTDAPHLREPRYHPMVLSLCRITLLIERSFDAIADENVIAASTGELRGSLGSFNNLIAQQTKLLNSLGLSPASSGKFVANARPVLDVDMIRDAEEK